MEPEPGEALLLFLRHYLSLAKEGIDASELQHLEDRLGEMNNLTAEDFSVVTEQWQESATVPSVDQFLDSLRRECALRIRSRVH